MTISISQFGNFKGKRVDQFTLTSDTGVEVDIITYGVAVRDWRVPVDGGKRSVVLGLDKFDDYPAHSPHLGALAGRVANRIGGAAFSIAGKAYRLPANEGPNQLHGGVEGLGMQVWDGEADEAANAVRFTHFSPDGAMGFPGNVTFTAVYTLKGNRLRLDLSAVTDRATPISLVQHQYFNLGTTDSVIDHVYQINASAFTQNDENLIPTGAILPVKGTKWDFQTSRTLVDADGKPVTYDGNLVLYAGRDFKDPIATVKAPDGALTLKLWSDQPGVQFYDAVYTDIPVPGLNGRHYGQFSGFCLEDQALPDAVNQPHFPSVITTPERPYGHWCEIEIA
jgi:aldose 1-epimerase